MGRLPVIAPPLAIALGVLALLAGVYDFRYRRIPNWLCVVGFSAGVALNVWLGGIGGLMKASLAGAALAIAVYLPLYLLRAVGGGDLKLMAAVGAIAGPELWLVLFVIASLLGGVAALVLVFARGRFGRTLSNVAVVLTELAHFRRPYLARPDLDVANASATRLPHAVVIACAIGLYLIALHAGE